MKVLNTQKIRRDWSPSGNPEAPRESINNVWLKDFEKFHSTIYFKNRLKNKILPELFRIIFGSEKMKRSPLGHQKIMIGQGN